MLTTIGNHSVGPQRERVAVVSFSVSVCQKLILKMSSFYLSKQASKHGRRLFKDFK